MADDPAVKKAFHDALNGLAVQVGGVVSNHNENLTEQGVQQIWNALKLADIKLTVT